MTKQLRDESLSGIQKAADALVECSPKERPDALEQLAKSIFDHFAYSYESSAVSALFSKELPNNIQRFSGAWLLRILTRSAIALQFGDTERLTASLFDQVFQHDVYRRANIDPSTQTFEKIQALTDFLQTIMDEADTLVTALPILEQVPAMQQAALRLFNDKSSRPLLIPLLSRELISNQSISNLFGAVKDYIDNEDTDPIYRKDTACQACEEFESEANSYGTGDADLILGGVARQLKNAVNTHFDSLEASLQPSLELFPIAKKYPLAIPGRAINFKIRISNVGTGPARDLMMEDIVSDTCLDIKTSETSLGTIQAGDSLAFDIVAEVLALSSKAEFLIVLSWVRFGSRESREYEFTVEAQREDIDWERVEFTEPYSLEAVTSGNDLIGRKSELMLLHRLANLNAVGSGFIYGQKRVGKTSLANAISESLESKDEANWVVIYRGSGDYVGDNATSTLRTLGEVLANSLRQRIPVLANLPTPDFSNGLAPLSSFVDEALRLHDCRILFILDEFDELPLALIRRTDLSTSLFQPLRQISNKSGCGFLLIGGEGMQQIINFQGDRLNKFRRVEVDYFSRSSNWSDFVELIRRPVQDWLTISDNALEELFKASAGNPYFAKLLASQLFSDMVDNRYSDASEVDMTNAIEKALRAIGGNSFAHFWTDGLVQNAENAEEIMIIRRTVLIAVGKALRKYHTVNSDVIWEEFRSTTGLPVELHSFQFTLSDFASRKVLVEDKQGSITAKVPLFQSWLKDKGVGELLGDSRELELLKSQLQDEERIRVKDDEILGLCDELKHFRYRGRAVEPMGIKTWLDQFGGPYEQRLMFRLLSGIRVYDENTLRAKMSEAFGIVTRNMRTIIESGVRVRSDILVSSLDDSAAKSGLRYCRMFASENRISSQSVQALRLLEQKISENQSIQRLVLIDDFSGSGQSIVAGLKRELEFLQRANREGIQIILICLVGFAESRSRIERFIENSHLEAYVYFCDELGSEHKAFSDASLIFPDADERVRARQIAESKGVMLEKRNPLGYRDTQASVVFYESCPNNTLPIFWSQNDQWNALFPRM